MLTTQIIDYAKEDGLTYESSFGTYDKENGFKFNDYGKQCFESDPDKFVTMLFGDDTIWCVKAPEPKAKDMTLSEIEDALGYKINLVKSKNEQKTKDYKETTYPSLEDVFNALFG